MRGLTAGSIADITGGELTGGTAARELPIEFVTTDSREAGPGCLFAAIKGERTDGHLHAAAAAEKGAACVLCERPVAGAPVCVAVPSTMRALAQIAAFYRAQFHIPVVGVTGSVGKTTGKEMAAAVLSRRFNTLYTQGNFNNELGVPLTLLRLRDEHEAAVVEMGISDFGEMARLTDMVRPDAAIFTIVGYSHLQMLGDRAGVLRAKSEITAGMPKNGVMFANGDDDLLRGAEFGLKKVLFGLSEHCDIRAENIAAVGKSLINCDIVTAGRRIAVSIPGFGEYMVYAALEGAAAGLHCGLTDAEIAAGIADFRSVGRRARVVELGGVTIIDDCYNSNPTSARAAIRSMAPFTGRKICVLGDMLELGEDSEKLHRELGEFAREHCDELLTCGDMARSMGGRHFESKSALADALADALAPGGVALIKASHSMKFEDITDALEKKLGGR